MTYQYSDMEVARYIEREAEKVSALVHMLMCEDENLSRSTLGTALSFIWNDIVSIRCDLEELSYERMEKI
jgi:hypothetical protein